MPLVPGIVIGSTLSTAGATPSDLGGDSGAMEFRGGELLLVVANVLWTWYSMMAQRWLAGYSQLHISGLTALTGLIGLYAVIAAVGATGMADFHIDLSLEPVFAAVIFGRGLGRRRQFAMAFRGQSRRCHDRVDVQQPDSNRRRDDFFLGGHEADGRATSLGAAVIIAGVLYAQVMAVRRQSAQAAAVEA